MTDTGNRAEASRLWPEREDRRLKDPERQLLDAIAAGELDAHLGTVADAVHARQQLLRTRPLREGDR